jgi:hypothetical protein
MELVEFFNQTRQEIQAQIADRLSNGDAYPYEESIFSEIVTKHMSEIGMTFEPRICHYSSKVGNSILRLSGYAISDDSEQLDLFVSLYAGLDMLTTVPDSETKVAAEQCLRFLTKCAEGRLGSTMDASNEAYPFAITIQHCYGNLDQIRLYVLTDRQTKAKNFQPRQVKGKTVKLEVMDIERLHRHWSEGKPRDELVVNFQEVTGTALPCVYVPGHDSEYDYALTAIPGEAIRFLYDRYDARLLEANVRSFLSANAKVNKGIRDTLKTAPGRFMAYNNGLVLVADEIHLGNLPTGGSGILWLKGIQIVNGGQTTASIYFTKKKNPEVDLTHVRVPAKIIVLRSQNPEAEEALISDISRYANSQNAVKMSDLSANKPFHVQIEKLSLSTYCPDGVGRWFYERAAGSYTTLLAKEGTTPAKLKKLRETLPTSRRITKTDLAKYLNSWAQKPDSVSVGSQKNFERFMADIDTKSETEPVPQPDVPTYKQMIAKAILFKRVQTIVRPLFPAFQGNVGTYVISLLANRFGERMDLEKIWLRQDISPELRYQIQIWAEEVNKVLQSSASGKMISEWAKKPECWDAIREASYSDPMKGIPEIR